MKFESCYLLEHNLIPRTEMNRVFTESYSASAEIDPSFLCFDEPYQMATCAADKDNIIIDFGCAYAPQSYYFKHCSAYIGVDLPMPMPSDPLMLYKFKPETRFTPDNASFYIMTIQKFLKEVYPTLDIPKEKVIAICSAVPDKEAQELVKQTFPVHYVWYPGQIAESTLPSPIHTLEDLFEKGPDSLVSPNPYISIALQGQYLKENFNKDDLTDYDR